MEAARDPSPALRIAHNGHDPVVWVSALFGEVRKDLSSEIGKVRKDLSSEIGEVRKDLSSLRSAVHALENNLALFKVDTAKWIVGAIAFNLLGTLGIMLALVELVAK